MKLAVIILRYRVLLLLPVLIGCVGTTPPSRFYLLEPVPETASSSVNSGQARMELALAPVKIPHYLTRPQMVTAAGTNTYQVDELHRWAESLDENMTRVMMRDLSGMIPADVVLSPAKRARRTALHLKVAVLEFHVDPQGQAGLVAQWQVERGDEVVLSRQNAYRIQADNDDASMKVKALNQCLNRLDQDIASAMAGLKAD